MIPAAAIETREPCQACRGSGRHGHREDETCPDCDGSGRVWAVPGRDRTEEEPTCSEIRRLREALNLPCV